MASQPVRSARRVASAWVHRRLVDAVARLHAKAVVDLASTAGRLSARLRGRPRPADVAAVFSGHPALSGLDPVRAAREVGACAFRARALSALARRHGLAPIAGLVDRDGLAPLRPLSATRASAVVVTWHFGPGCGISAAFQLCGIKGWAVTRRPLPVEEANASLLVGDDAEERARTLWRAIGHLKDGGIVVIAADGLAGERTREVAFLGRRLGLSRGAFVLARLSGAPLVPMVATWTPARNLQIVVGRPLVVDAPRTDADAFESRAATVTAEWMEQRVLAAPHELRPHMIRLLAASPRV